MAKSPTSSEPTKRLFLLIQNHPVAGMRFRTAYEDAETARKAALDAYDENIPEGRSPSEYEFFVIKAEEVVERGDKRE